MKGDFSTSSKPRVVAYLRVSTAEQSVENQLRALEKWVVDFGIPTLLALPIWRRGTQGNSGIGKQKCGND